LLRLPPGGRLPRSARDDTELLTYVREGAVTYEDSSGRLYIIRAGEFSRITGGPGARWTETNPSQTEGAQLFRICLGGTAAGVEPGCEQKRFSLAERRGKLCVVASPDGRNGSLRIHRDVLIYSSVFAGGQHVVHELPPGRCAWLHVVSGEVSLGDVVLTRGDGVVVATERAVSFTAREDGEVLLLHLEEH
jgi:redox-sensitive bicupin YhaK (pirin superfamily)